MVRRHGIDIDERNKGKDKNNRDDEAEDGGNDEEWEDRDGAKDKEQEDKDKTKLEDESTYKTLTEDKPKAESI